MNFRHLHAHSGYSFLDGFGRPEQIRDRIQQLGHDQVSITDHGNTFAHAPYSKSFFKSGIAPIYGIEFYIVDDLKEKVQTKGILRLGVNTAPHVTVIARNQKGYENLLHLNRIAQIEGFYYKPRIDWSTLAQFSEGLIVLSGCPGGYPTRILIEKGYQAAKDFIHDKRNRIEHFYVEVVPCPGLDISYQSSDLLAQIAQELRIPLVLTADAHFPMESDHEVQDLMLCVGIGKQLRDPDRTLRLPSYQYYCTGDELLERAKNVFKTTPESSLIQALENTAIIASMCDVQIPKGTTVSFPDCTDDKPANVLLWEWVIRGLHQRWGEGKITPETYDIYVKRAQHEHITISNKGFCDYILAIGDVVKHVKDNGGLVMCRGSAGGSVLLWLIGASETDPILHDLSFERFYDDNRPDPPDVDIDFEKKWRDRAIDYIYDRYGRENCARLGAVSQLTARSALQDVAFAYGIPRSEFGMLSDSLDSKDEDTDGQIESISDPDVLRILEKRPELMIFKKVIGQFRQSTIHACGVVVANDPLDKMIGIVRDTEGNPVAAVDKKAASDLGFLKMDLLVVTTLDCLSEAATNARGDEKWLYNLPIDDRESYRTAKELNLAGIFQLDGNAAKRVASEIGLDEFNDLVAASALCRPGPADWVDRYKTHKSSASLFSKYLGDMSPIASNVVKKTYGILLYQEQVMKIAREVACFDWPSVHKLRKGITSSGGAEVMAQWENKFVDGCMSNGVSRKEAEFWWISIATHGSYSFNKCLTGDTIVLRGCSGPHGGNDVTIKELYDAQESKSCWGSKIRNGKLTIMQLSSDRRVRPSFIKRIYNNGVQEVFEVVTKLGNSIKATSNHRLLTSRGYLMISEMTTGDDLVLMGDKNKYECAHVNPLSELDGDYYQYHSKDNMLYLCNPCHKKFDIDKGERPKRNSKGRTTIESKIISIRPVGFEQTYDIEMNTEEHNFIANGIVSHNSHCVTYGIMSYWGLYLKTHCPNEFYEAALRTESLLKAGSFVSQKRFIREFQQRGGRVSLIDPLKMDPSFRINDGVLTGGLCDLKGIGSIMAERVIQKGPCSSFDEFMERIPKAVSKKLVKAFNSGEWDPAILLQVAPWFPIPNTLAQDEQNRWEMGFGTVRDILRTSPQKVTVAGYISYIKIDKGKAIGLIEDSGGFLVVRVSNRLKDVVTPKLKNINIGDFVAINGWWSGDILYAQDSALIRRVI